MPETTIMEAAVVETPFPEFLDPLPPVSQRPRYCKAAPKRLAVVTINDTFLEVLEAPSGSACNNCPFAMHDSMPHSPPVCCIPDYLACRPHLRFRIAELKRGVPS